MARVASVAAVACAVLVTAWTAGHSPPVAAGAGTRSQSTAQETAAACSSGVPAGLPPVQGAAYVSGGCGASRCCWERLGVGVVGDPPRIRYALAERGQVAGLLFGYPLMAGNPSPTQTRSCGLSRPCGTACRCGLPVIRSVPLGPLCHRPGRRIRSRGRFTSPRLWSLRRAAGSSRCPGMGIRRPLSFGMSGTGKDSGIGHSRRPGSVSGQADR